MNTRNNFSFKGRYTLRGINNSWNIYDRELNANIKGLNARTFKDAEKELLKFKAQHNDKI